MEVAKIGGQLLDLTDPKTNAEVEAWVVAGRSPGFGMRLRRWLPESDQVPAEASLRIAGIAIGPHGEALRFDWGSGGFRVLSLEASIVRVEALRGLGQSQAARALSERLLREHSDGPYTERLRALLASFRSARAGQDVVAD